MQPRQDSRSSDESRFVGRQKHLRDRRVGPLNENVLLQLNFTLQAAYGAGGFERPAPESLPPAINKFYILRPAAGKLAWRHGLDAAHQVVSSLVVRKRPTSRCCTRPGTTNIEQSAVPWNRRGKKKASSMQNHRPRKKQSTRSASCIAGQRFVPINGGLRCSRLPRAANKTPDRVR